MREIKFRTWADDYMQEDISTASTASYNGLVPHEGAVLMQYTGLKDKNGVEIYEGDIVARKNVTVWEKYTDAKGEVWNRMTNRKADHFAEVYYNPKKAAFETNNSHLWLAGGYPDIEVIGNIYENEDLLK